MRYEQIRKRVQSIRHECASAVTSQAEDHLHLAETWRISAPLPSEPSTTCAHHSRFRFKLHALRSDLKIRSTFWSAQSLESCHRSQKSTNDVQLKLTIYSPPGGSRVGGPVGPPRMPPVRSCRGAAAKTSTKSVQSGLADVDTMTKPDKSPVTGKRGETGRADGKSPTCRLNRSFRCTCSLISRTIRLSARRTLRSSVRTTRYGARSSSL